MTTIPTAEQLATFKTAWAEADDAGLEGSRTVLALTAVLSMPSPTTPIPPKRVFDKDHDVWELNERTGLWDCTTLGGMMPKTYEELQQVFGPLTETR